MNECLRNELLLMQEKDQLVLQELIDNGELGCVEYHPRIKALHEKHNIRIKEIINEFGWPSISLVGADGSKAAWLLVQHAILDTEFMGACLNLLEAAVNENEAKSWCFAYLQDRILTMSDKLQIYGTQHDIDCNGIAFPMPIEAPNKVECRRAKMGLDSLSEATKRVQKQHDVTMRNDTKKS